MRQFFLKKKRKNEGGKKWNVAREKNNTHRNFVIIKNIIDQIMYNKTMKKKENEKKN